MQLGIEVNDEFRKYVNEDLVYELVEHCLKIPKFDSEVELSLLITGDETVRDLNHRYRGINDTTDVLSFALTEGDPDIPPFIIPPDGIIHLGEVIISCPQAVMQAKSAGHDIDTEMSLLIVHGILHLLGYDHDKPDREIEMRGLEKKILDDVARKLP